MLSSDEVVYQRNIVPRWARGICVVILVGLAVIMPIVQPAESDVPFVVDSLVYVGAWGIPVWIALITMWAVDRNGRVVLTGETLRVGRSRLAVDDIDRESVLLAARDSPGLWERVVASAGQIDWEAVRLRTTGRARLLGGGYATPMGAGTVQLTLCDGGAVLVPTTDRAGLIEALLRVVPETP